MVLLRDHLSDLMCFQDRMSEQSLDSVDLNRRGFWEGAVDEDGLEDAVFQAVLGGENDFVHSEVESHVVTAEPRYP